MADYMIAATALHRRIEDVTLWCRAGHYVSISHKGQIIGVMVSPGTLRMLGASLTLQEPTASAEQPSGMVTQEVTGYNEGYDDEDYDSCVGCGRMESDCTCAQFDNERK